MERTVVLIKPDGVKRGLVGEIIARLEKVGLKIVAMKMVWVDKTLVGKHYQEDKEYFKKQGERLLAFYQEHGMDPKEYIGTLDPVEMGRTIRKWNMEFLSSGPVVAMLLTGPHAVEIVRKIVGATFPQLSAAGTIRGDYSADSPVLSNTLKRPVKNLIHASGTVAEAKLEEELWFRRTEIHDYKRTDEEIMFG